MSSSAAAEPGNHARLEAASEEDALGAATVAQRGAAAGGEAAAPDAAAAAAEPQAADSASDISQAAAAAATAAAAAAERGDVAAVLGAAVQAAADAGWILASPDSPATTSPAAAAALAGGDSSEGSKEAAEGLGRKRQREAKREGARRARSQRGRSSRGAAACREEAESAASSSGLPAAAGAGGVKAEEGPESGAFSMQSPRSNPERLCRRRAAPLATTIEWTRMQVEHCKNLAEKVVWSTTDSAVLRDSLEVRPEPTPGVGLGLYLKRPLCSCCCEQAALTSEAEQRLMPELRLLHQQQQQQQQLGEQGGLLLAAIGGQQTAGFAEIPDRSPRLAAVSPLKAQPAASHMAGGQLLQQLQQQQGEPQEPQNEAGQGQQVQQGTEEQQYGALLPGHAAAAAAAAAAAEAVSNLSPAARRAAALIGSEAAVAVLAPGKRKARVCSCSPSSCFRILCFRGDPVLSPFNFMAAAGEGALSDEEMKVLMAPHENPGFEPYQHLSPAFTLSRFDMPFSLQLQADPYLSSEIVEDVKAIYANHYCALHCKGFFEQWSFELLADLSSPSARRMLECEKTGKMLRSIHSREEFPLRVPRLRARLSAALPLLRSRAVLAVSVDEASQADCRRRSRAFIEFLRRGPSPLLLRRTYTRSSRRLSPRAARQTGFMRVKYKCSCCSFCSLVQGPVGEDLTS
ncbi:hypothetical protein Efla_001633 [Eimeria flavescens]